MDHWQCLECGLWVDNKYTLHFHARPRDLRAGVDIVITEKRVVITSTEQPEQKDDSDLRTTI